MNEHDDDVEPEVEDGVEVEEFPVLTEEDEEAEAGGGQGTAWMEPDIDPDKSEI